MNKNKGFEYVNSKFKALTKIRGETKQESLHFPSTDKNNPETWFLKINTSVSCGHNCSSFINLLMKILFQHSAGLIFRFY